MIQFATPMKDFRGNDVCEAAPGAMPDALLSDLRARALAAGAVEEQIAWLDELSRPMRAMTLADVCCRSLNGEQQKDVKAAVARFKLIGVIIEAEQGKKPLVLSVEDLATIQRAIAASSFTPWISGQAIELLERERSDSSASTPAS